MFRTRIGPPHLGLVVLGVLACSCSPADDDSGRMPVISAGAGGQSVPQAGANSVAGVAPPAAGRGGLPGTAGSAAAGGIGGALAGGSAGAPGVAGTVGAAGMAAARGPAGMSGAAGAGGAAAGMSGTAAAGGAAAGMSGTAGASGATAASGETGRMVGMTAAHNAVRAMVMTMPPLPPLTWSPTLAAYAQEWADNLAKTQCNRPMHRSQQELQSKRYGENLAAAGGVPAPMTTAQWATDGWAGEVKCWTYGTLGGTEKCDVQCYQQMRSDGCGHYTQVVWRATTQLGCGVASCQSGGATWDIWICNYSPPGNVIGQKPY